MGKDYGHLSRVMEGADRLEIESRDSRISCRVRFDGENVEYSFLGINLWGKRLKKRVGKYLKILGVGGTEFEPFDDDVVVGDGEGGIPTPKQVNDFYHRHRRNYSGNYRLVVEKSGETKSYILNRGL